MPNDISELDLEAAELRRELRTQIRVARLRRVFETRRWRRYGISGPLVVVVLLVVLFFASLVFLLLPTTPHSPAPLPLAQPTVPPGAAGALLPDLALPIGRADSVRLRNLRPAVILLGAARCDCVPLMIDVIKSTSASRLQVLVVGEGAEPELPSIAPADRVHAGVDTDGRLVSTYPAGATPMVLFVRSDGVVSRVLSHASPGSEIHDEVAALAH